MIVIVPLFYNFTIRNYTRNASQLVSVGADGDISECQTIRRRRNSCYCFCLMGVTKAYAKSLLLSVTNWAVPFGNVWSFRQWYIIHEGILPVPLTRLITLDILLFSDIIVQILSIQKMTFQWKGSACTLLGGLVKIKRIFGNAYYFGIRGLTVIDGNADFVVGFQFHKVS